MLRYKKSAYSKYLIPPITSTVKSLILCFISLCKNRTNFPITKTYDFLQNILEIKNGIPLDTPLFLYL